MSVIRKINGEWKTIQISRKFKQLLVQKNWESTVNKRPTEGTKQFYKVVNMFVHSYIAQNIDKVLYISSQMLNIYVVLWIFFFHLHLQRSLYTFEDYGKSLHNAIIWFSAFC